MRDYVRLYCHLGGGRMEEFYTTSPEDAHRFADLACQAVAEGFSAFKAMAVPETMPLEGLNSDSLRGEMRGRDAGCCGRAIDIMVDCHARPSPPMGLLFAKALEPFGLYWFEEPCWPETMDDIALIRRAVKTPIATGERLVGIPAFRELLEKHAASVIQPDITHCGGLSEVRRIAALAEAYRVALAPHNPQGPVSTAASLEFGFATPSYIICESVHADVPWRVGRGEPKGLLWKTKAGSFAQNKRPGLGIEINEEEVQKHPFQQEVLQRSFYKDGSVGDW